MFSQSFIQLIPKLNGIAKLNLVARSAFPAEMIEEGETLPTEDYWTETDHYWIRQHVIPRRTLFTPKGTTGGPDHTTLSGRRLTKICHEDDKYDVKK